MRGAAGATTTRTPDAFRTDGASRTARRIRPRSSRRGARSPLPPRRSAPGNSFPRPGRRGGARSAARSDSRLNLREVRRRRRLTLRREDPASLVRAAALRPDAHTPGTLRARPPALSPAPRFAARGGAGGAVRPDDDSNRGPARRRGLRIGEASGAGRPGVRVPLRRGERGRSRPLPPPLRRSCPGTRTPRPSGGPSRSPAARRRGRRTGRRPTDGDHEPRPGSAPRPVPAGVPDRRRAAGRGAVSA